MARFVTASRLALLASAAFACAGLSAQTVELVSHNGFEGCWPSALSKQGFLDLLRSEIDGQSACIAPQSGSASGFTYTTCNTAACGGGALGCPLTVRAGAFTGDVSSGSFSAPGSVDDIQVPISYSGPLSGTCTITASDITLSYGPVFHVTDDGNNGKYMAYLTPATSVTLTAYNLSGSDAICQGLIDANNTDAIKTQMEQAAAEQVVQALSAANASVCPLTP
ncbi:MAG TPA: hypothetical protein VFN09_15230 [Rhodanobacteraceae bacterium]|nr:hypothetical protein [Rhodanobacteraceae bacterium]